MRLHLSILLLLLAPIGLWAQEESTPVAGLAFGVHASSFGFGFEMRYLLPREDWNYHIGLGLGSFKHPQEAKIESAYADQGGKDYVYDKLNYCYTLHPSFGVYRRVIGSNPFNKVSLSLGASAGPLLALLKPYYVEVPVPFNGNQSRVEAFAYDPGQHGYSNIFGSADYFLGMNQISLLPGGRIKVSAMVDLSANTRYIRAIEVGLFADAYAKRLPLLGLRENKQAFLGGSVGILVGDTW